MKLSAAIKSSFVAGLILVTPLVITLYVLRILVGWVLQFTNPIVQGTRLTQYTANIEVVAQILTVALIIVGITLLGFLARMNIGRRMFGNLGRIVNVIPLVNTLYSSVRQVANALVDRDAAYDDVVLVEYPKKDIYTIGFVTGGSPTVVEDVTGKRAYNVFLPNSPNPTAGRLILLPEDQLHELDMSVRRGMQLVVTTGLGSNDETVPMRDPEHLPDR